MRLIMVLIFLAFSGFTFTDVTEIRGTVTAERADFTISTDLPDEQVIWDGDNFILTFSDNYETSLIQFEVDPLEEKYDVRVNAEIVTKDGIYTYESINAVYRSWYRMREKHNIYVVGPRL